MAGEGSIAAVTGAGSGIGRAVSIALLEAGYDVFLAGRNLEGLEETVTLAANATGEAIIQQTDVTDQGSVAGLFKRITEQSGRLDVMFNNAGQFPPSAPPDEIELDDWLDNVAVNLTGAFLIARGAFRLMKEQSPQGGRIINNGSVSAQVPRHNALVYTTTKHGVTGLTKSLALDGRQHNIACSQIDIGNAATDFIVRVHEAALARGDASAEETMDVKAVSDAVLYIANLPLEANVLFMTLLATQMPFVGRG